MKMTNSKKNYKLHLKLGYDSMTIYFESLKDKNKFIEYLNVEYPEKIKSNIRAKELLILLGDQICDHFGDLK